MGTSGTIEQGQQGQQGATPLCACQVKAVLEAMPSSNLKPAGEDVLIDLDERRYRQTFMFSATMPPQAPRLAPHIQQRPLPPSLPPSQPRIPHYECMNDNFVIILRQLERLFLQY